MSLSRAERYFHIEFTENEHGGIHFYKAEALNSNSKHQMPAEHRGFHSN